MEIRTVDIGLLKPADYNPRKNLTPKDPEYQKIKKSIEQFGYLDLIIWNERSGRVVGGHQRLKVLESLGYKDIEVVVADLADDDEKAFNIALNKIAGDWDLEKLSTLMIDLKEIDFDVELTGFSEKEVTGLTNTITDGLTDGDETPKDVDATVKEGEIWALGDHYLICGDATKKEDIAVLMGNTDDKIDMVFTDPPYGVDIGGKNKFLNKFQKSGRILKNIENDSLGSTDDLYELLLKCFTNYYKFGADHCAYYVTAPQGGDLGLMMMMMMMQDSGLPVRHVLIWLKNSPTFSLGRLDYDYKHEPILYGWKKNHKFYAAGEHTKSVWSIARPNKSKLHPTMKPVELITNAILNSSGSGDIVADFFGGSGSTMIACEKTNRHCRMMEIEPHYCDVIIKRWEDFTGKKAENIK